MGKTMRIAAITLFIARVVRRWCDRTTIVLRAAGAVVQGGAARHRCDRAASRCGKCTAPVTNVKSVTECVAQWWLRSVVGLSLCCLRARQKGALPHASFVLDVRAA